VIIFRDILLDNLVPEKYAGFNLGQRLEILHKKLNELNKLNKSENPEIETEKIEIFCKQFEACRTAFQEGKNNNFRVLENLSACMGNIEKSQKLSGEVSEIVAGIVTLLKRMMDACEDARKEWQIDADEKEIPFDVFFQYILPSSDKKNEILHSDSLNSDSLTQISLGSSRYVFLPSPAHKTANHSENQEAQEALSQDFSNPFSSRSP
jgi:hypothetical protein